jgi:hypothetical protein
MKALIGFQDVFLDFLIQAGKVQLVWSIYDRSAINVRSFAAISLHESMSINGEVYRCPYLGERKSLGDRYVERVDFGRDKITSMLVVASAVNDEYIITTKEHMYDDLYSYCMEHFDLPILKEWMPYIYSKCSWNNNVVLYEDCVLSDRMDRFIDIGFGNVKLSELKVIKIKLKKTELMDIITSGLTYKEICITKNEVDKLQFKTLDEYYEKYGKEIVKNLKGLLKPLTEINGHLDKTATRTKKLFPAQANGVNALIARLQKSNYAIVNMDMGTGKTLQALSACDAYFNDKMLRGDTRLTLKDLFEKDLVNYKVAVLCPSHLVDKWVSEGSEIANLNCVAVKTFEQLIEISSQKELYSKGKHLFVFSKDFAKLGDTQAPIPTITGKGYLTKKVCRVCKENTNKYIVKPWDTNKCYSCGQSDWVNKAIRHSKTKGLLCPDCGNLLMTRTDKFENCEPLRAMDFTKRRKSNQKCYHCGALLWGSQVKNIGNSANYRWQKYGYFTNKSHKSKSSAWVLKGHLKEFISDYNLEPGEYWESQSFGPRKYSPARYIAKHMKNFFDFFIADECHMYETSSAQGQAFETFVKNSKKTLALTGTLTNGKATGLFYMFWRLDPRKMKKNGFEFYGDEGLNKWNNRYGVMESRERVTESEYNSSSRGTKQTRSNVRPGISPQIIRDFLLESVVQLQISDLSEGLPKLNEKIVTVPLEEGVESSLKDITSSLREYANSKKCPAMNMLALQYQLFYSDKPFDIKPILDPLHKGDIVMEPVNFDYFKTSGFLNKERKLCEIVENELNEKRNCYIYVEKTGHDTDFFELDRVKSVLEANVANAKVLILEANTVKAEEREAWFKGKVEREGYNIIISNPRLVETGIDFVWTKNGVEYNFPTLIFFQCGFKLDTLWQASRRAYRLIQKKECRTYYMCSEGTMQLDVLQLMAEKQVSVSSIQGGEFSARGLAAMAKSVDPKIELARRLREGKTADAKEVQQMFSAFSKSSSQLFDGCKPNLLISDITDFDCLGIVKDEVIQTINNVNTKIKTEKVISINTDWPAMNVFDMFGGNKDTNTNDDIDSNVSKDANKKVKRKKNKKRCKEETPIKWDSLFDLLGGI